MDRKLVTNQAIEKARVFRMTEGENSKILSTAKKIVHDKESGPFVNNQRVISTAKCILFEDNQADDLDTAGFKKFQKTPAIQAAFKYIVEDIMELTPEEYDAIYSTVLNQKSTLDHIIRKIVNNAPESVVREALFDAKKILFRQVWPDYYRAHYKPPVPMDIFDASSEVKGNLIRAGKIKDLDVLFPEASEEAAVLRNGKFSSAKKERKRTYNHGEDVDRVVYWAMSNVLPFFKMTTRDLFLSLAKPNESGWSKYGFAKIIEARECYPTPLDFYFLNSPLEYQMEHLEEYVQARKDAKLKPVKALDMMYDAYCQSIESERDR